ncbi:bestrophin family ion channel [Mycolicibacterium gilvum]|uniref:Predicted membrane protein n=2 Tax=Mycolicibacterium gilvum TaxID=1804 RepID=E6TP65_MYCSR|nr:bestrophin family ion channel [Mycolicibacterium gilvum]ABP46008.1 conserved hypothetical protein [Mycolicibacterium gilvum PYR-GCK]ADT99498.1 predicted membrane protein [Mycolicibacterium gilvum Spyr1]
MIRSVGRTGPLKVAGRVCWALRFDVAALVVAAAVLVPIPDAIQEENAVAVLSVLGISATIFIGFRNTTAYNRWWEARTLWGSIVINCRALDNALSSVDTGAESLAAVHDRMRRRQVRHAWQLACELRGVDPPAAVAELTPEDPREDGATSLLNRQARDIQTLSRHHELDNQGRSMLMALNTALVGAQSGLERIRNQPIPIHYDLFIRVLAWFFGLMVFNRIDGSSDSIASIVLGLAVMSVFVIAERLGHFIEVPMGNTVFDLPMFRFCSTVTGNLLGGGHPLARPREPATATVWM